VQDSTGGDVSISIIYHVKVRVVEVVDIPWIPQARLQVASLSARAARNSKSLLSMDGGCGVDVVLHEHRGMEHAEKN
jgi:hypothetical protein